jgi:hypothetical protein
MTTWNRYSAVTHCPDCEGTGYVAAYTRASVDNPYPERPCDCGLGQHEAECEVCGFNQYIAGYDCLVCDTVAGILDADLQQFDHAAFSAAFAVALEAARKELSK